jgi:predicted RNase H-like HicB family nuclease
MKKAKLLKKLLSGSKNIKFAEAVTIAEAFGFRLSRTNGNYHIYVHPEIPDTGQSAKQQGKNRAVSNQTVIATHRTIQSSNGERNMKDYHVNLFYSDEDEGYIADIPDLKNCSAFGETPEEALHEVLKAKKAWLEAAQAEGKPIPKPSFRPVIYQAA